MRVTVTLKIGTIPEDEGTVVAVLDSVQDVTQVIETIEAVTHKSYSARTAVVSYFEPATEGVLNTLNLTVVIDD